MFLFQDGDVLVTYGSGGVWPPRRWVLWVVYRGIRAFQRAKWGSGADTGPTHVRVWLGGQFFEMTTPVGKWTTRDEVILDKKDWKVARFRGAIGNFPAMQQKAGAMVGLKYDIGDLLDFGLSGLVGRFAGWLRIFGDRERKYTVCSTALAKVLRAGGVPFRVSRDDVRRDAGVAVLFRDGADPIDLIDSAIDPAYFVNNPTQWEVVGQSSR